MTISKEILSFGITIAIFLLLQTGALIWFLSKLNASINFLTQTMSRLEKSLEGFVTVSHLTEKLKRIWDAVDENKKDIATIQKDLNTHLREKN